MADIQPGDLVTALDEAALGRSHFRAVLASGMGFFTDAYDLFVIGIASALITKDWHLGPGQLAVLNSTMLAAAFLGAMAFGRYADVVGRKRVYWLVAAIMIAGALGSALSGSFWVLIGFRFLLGSGASDDTAWRVLLALQLTGFAVMALCFLVIAAVPGMTTAVVPFLLVYGVSYFFTEFGPNMTTFVLPSELYPTAMRTTGHGISAGIGKLGAFIGVFLFPVLHSSLGLRGTLLLTAVISGLGFALTLVLPEPAGRSLDEIAGGPADTDTRPQPVTRQAPAA